MLILITRQVKDLELRRINEMRCVGSLMGGFLGAFYKDRNK
jgi:hypothetical protein